MKNRTLGIVLACALLLGAWLVSGCGEKIDVPVPVGDWGTSSYIFREKWEDPDGAFLMSSHNGFLYVLGDSTLSRRNLNYEEQNRLGGLSGARAFCIDTDASVLFVWEQDANRVSWYDASDFTFQGSALLQDLGIIVSMATNPAGIDLAAGAQTFLYLTDDLNGVIHRFAFDEFNGLSPFGILSRRDGDSARFVRQGAGMATDSEGRLLVCDRFPQRNWVIRFDSAPDTTDLASYDPWEGSQYRGKAVVFHDNAICDPPPLASFVLGYAPDCGDLEWVGRTGSAVGEFDDPQGVTVDGSGRILVADTNNNRVQFFDSAGSPVNRDLRTEGELDFPSSIVVISQRIGPTTYHAAQVFLLSGATNEVVKYEDSEVIDDPNS